MTNFKLSSRMHLMIIISAVIIAIDLAVGLVCEFVADGYFNYGTEYASYQSVEVNYAYVDANTFGGDEGVKEICDKAFSDKSVSYKSCTHSETNDGWQYVFTFSSKADKTALASSVSAISEKLGGEQLSGLSTAYLHEVNTQMGNSNPYIYGAIALAVAVAVQFLYFVIRYKLTMAFAALLADVHSFALFISLAAITRVPLGSQAVVFGVLTVLATMIGCAYVFGKLRSNLKDENFAKLGNFEQVDTTVLQSLVNIAVPSAGVFAAAAVIFVLLSISAMSVAAAVTPVVLAVIGAAVSFYGSAFFTPSVYSRFKQIGDNYKAAHSKKSAKQS